MWRLLTGNCDRSNFIIERYGSVHFHNGNVIAVCNYAVPFMFGDLNGAVVITIPFQIVRSNQDSQLSGQRAAMRWKSWFCRTRKIFVLNLKCLLAHPKTQWAAVATNFGDNMAQPQMWFSFFCNEHMKGAWASLAFSPPMISFCSVFDRAGLKIEMLSALLWGRVGILPMSPELPDIDDVAWMMKKHGTKTLSFILVLLASHCTLDCTYSRPALTYL